MSKKHVQIVGTYIGWMYKWITNMHVRIAVMWKMRG